MAEKSGKRKRTVLSIEKKLQICKKLRNGATATDLSKEFEVGKSTITDIRKSEDKLRSFASKMDSTSGSLKRKTMKMASDSVLDDALYLWFAQKRSQGIPITGPILIAKALDLNSKINRDQQFKASSGWLKNFQTRHGIRQLSIQGETMSADNESVPDFKSTLSQIIEDKGLTLNQVYNCDETGLFWKALPTKTLASAKEAKAPGFKVSKERVTILACSNVTGDHKLRLTMIGKAKNPRAFKGLSQSVFPLWYTHQKKAWMESNIFQHWFFNEFVPATVKYLSNTNLPIKALLVLDNAPSHPSSEHLQSHDGNIEAIFLPPNTTSIIQPMDQGVLESVKRRYRKKLLQKILLADDPASEDPELGVIEFWKSLNLKDVMFLVANAWDEIPPSSIQASWNKLISPCSDTSVEEDTSVIPDMLETLGSVPGCSNCDEGDVRNWITMDANDQGYQLLSDDEIIQSVVECRTPEDSELNEVEDEEAYTEQTPLPSHSDALDMLTQCLSWVEQQPETTPTQIFLFKNLISVAARKRNSSLKQKKITSYFNK